MAVSFESLSFNERRSKSKEWFIKEEIKHLGILEGIDESFTKCKASLWPY